MYKCDSCGVPINIIPEWPLVHQLWPDEPDPDLGIWCSEECRNTDDDKFMEELNDYYK